MVGGTGKYAINKLGPAAIQVFIRKAEAGKAEKTKLSDGDMRSSGTAGR